MNTLLKYSFYVNVVIGKKSVKNKYMFSKPFT